MNENTPKEERSDPVKRLNRQELIDLLQKRREDLGRNPTRKDMPEGTIGAYRSEFDKWVYALEAAGFKHPSEKTLQRRRKRRKRMESLKKRKPVNEKGPDMPDDPSSGAE